ncbi:hypothetical protein N7466_001819 [Penicillium verhagenii]|uniref:uncharacterized protein n=1 Tax=Penicillium verhagenii TaxID=1562060 RepID=UPI002544DD8A|nr:uncharacterized protein N7466_001819 [Penicillium verhagenii]KAJ5938685.1 hypothetical protein N7466_001819 [Penicillium verhagenii]
MVHNGSAKKSTGHADSEFDFQQRHKQDRERKPRPKRIIICCDGTWQSSVSGEKNVPSNVTRLCRAINPIGTDAEGNEFQQIVWYDSGIGSTSSLLLGTIHEGATGSGFEGNVIEAYNYCVLNWNPGDQIMAFGFSRGAFTARSIAGVITDIGLCNKADLNKFPELWKNYKTFKTNKDNKGKRFFHSKSWFEWMWGTADITQGAGDAKSGDDWAQKGSRAVEVVGVYDTVGAIGMPEVAGVKIPQWLSWKENPEWQSVGLSTHIKYAFQALAIDEQRKAFEPTLFFVPPQKDGTKEELLKNAVKENKEAYEKNLQKAKKLKTPKKETKAGKRAKLPTDASINEIAGEVNALALKWNDSLRHLINYQDRSKKPTELVQVWFPGYHINVGGGASETMHNKGNMEEMSNIAYSWMLDQLKKHLSLNEAHINQEYDLREANFRIENKKRLDWNIMTKDETWGTWALRRSFEVASAIRHPLTAGPVPPFEENRSYDWGTAAMEDSYSKMYWLNGKHVRTPGRYAYVAGDRSKSLGETFEYIHPVVKYRFDQARLKHKDDSCDEGRLCEGGPMFKRRLVNKNGSKPHFVWNLTYDSDPSDVITLKEWPLGGGDCYERKAIGKIQNAMDWVGQMDDAMKVGSKASHN